MVADLAIGISKVVEALVSKVESAIKEEAEQWKIVQSDVVFMRDEFETMQSFLNCADREVVKTKVVATWVRQIRDLSYEFEDCIEFVLHLDTEKRGSWWLRCLPPSFRCSEGVALPVDEAVTQIKQLRARIVDVSQRSKRYRFAASVESSASSSNSLAPPKLKLVFLDDSRDRGAWCRNIGVLPIDLTMLVNGESRDRQVISVCGAGDLGTLSIIRTAYDDSKTKGNFRCRAWVKVMHPINPPEFIRSLLVQFYANACHEPGGPRGMDALSRQLCRLKLRRERDALSWTGTSAGDLAKEFDRQINAHRYLIILEDLSSVVQWEAVSPYLRDRKNGSRIVVSTRHHEIASLCTGKSYQVSELQGFSSAAHSVCVFFDKGSVDAVRGTRDNYCLVGRDLEVTKLLNMVTNRPCPGKPHVVSVWGFPGSGKTAVVTDVFKRCRSYDVTGYFNSWSLIDMYQQSKRMGFCRWLLSCPRSASLQLKGNDPMEECRYLLDEYRCLVVVDEVQSKEDWDLIFANLMSTESRSCIIVVAKEESVAIHCAGADNLVCSIQSLQPTAAFDLLQQIFPKNRNSFGKEEFQSGPKLYEIEASRYIFGMNSLEQAFQNNGYSNKEQTSQNNGDSHKEQTSQNNGESHKEQASQNNGDSHKEQASQNNGDSHEEQASQNNGDSCQEHASQNNGDSHEEHASQNNGDSHEQKATQNNGDSHKEQACMNNGDSQKGQASQNNGYSHKEEISQNIGHSLGEQAFRNNERSFKEEILWNTNSFGQILFSLFNKVNEQAENVLQDWSSFEEEEFRDSRHSFQTQAVQTSRPSFEDQSFQNSENPYEYQAFQNDGTLLGEPEVQNFMKSLDNQNNMKPLQEHNSQDKKENMPLDNRTVKDILSRSGGLPQVIVAIGRYLDSNQHMSNIQNRLLANFMQELQTNPQFYCLRGLLAWMHSYFWSSPPSLMRCMLYLSIFTQGQTFRRRRLVRRWIAEGFAFANGIESNNSDGFAGELFQKLASQGVVQQAAPTTDTDDARYEVNGFLHEYMITRPVEEKIFFPLEVSVLEEGPYSLAAERIGQHLSIGSRWDRDEFEFHTLDFSRLRSLTVSGEWRSFFISGKMRVLRVLDLEGTVNLKVDDLNEIGELLPRLKFLSLRGCNEITHLPESIGGLRQLQTLDIRHTSVITLPLSITKLQKLQYVRAGTTVPMDDVITSTIEIIPAPEAVSVAADPSLSAPSTSRPRAGTLMSRCPLPVLRTRRRSHLAGSGNGGVKLLGGIGKMVALHTLGVIDVSVASGRAVLEELKNLTQLRKLAVSGVNRENCKELCSAFSRHVHLGSLSVWFDKGMNQAAGCLDAISPPPAKLQSLKLYRHVDRKLPTWIRPHQVLNLSKLHLHVTMIPKDEIEVLGDLRKLTTLTLCLEEFPGGELQFQRGFNVLQFLEIACNCSLQAVTLHSGVMCNLEVLKLHCRHVPSSLRFSGLEKLHNLNQVLLSGSYEDALKQQLQSLLDEHPKEIKLVLKV